MAEWMSVLKRPVCTGHHPSDTQTSIASSDSLQQRCNIGGWTIKHDEINVSNIHADLERCCAEHDYRSLLPYRIFGAFTLTLMQAAMMGPNLVPQRFQLRTHSSS